MKPSWLNWTILVGLLLALAGSVGARAQDPVYPQAGLSSAFTYQGNLAENGIFANGDYDFRFILYDAEVGGAQVGNIVFHEDLTVIEGYFAVILDFGAGALNGNARWLEIAVRDGNSSGSYTTLSPRQLLAATPYASYAAAAPWSGLKNIPSGLNDGDDDTLAKLQCANNQVAKWNGTMWACTADKDTTYTPGFGLSLTGNEFSVVMSQVQKRVANNCEPGNSIRRIYEDGTVSCEPDTLDALVCANGQIAKWNGTAWACTTDKDTTYTAGFGLNLTGSEFSAVLSQVQKRVGNNCEPGNSIRRIYEDGTVSCEADTLDALVCANGQIAKWNGTAWACAADKDTDTTYTAGFGLSLASGEFSAVIAQVQKRVTGSCPTGSAIRVINQDGTVECEVDDITVSASNLNTGTLNNSRFSSYSDLAEEGHLSNDNGDLAQNNSSLQPNLNADLLDGYHANQLVPVGAFAGGDQSLALGSTPAVVKSVIIQAPSAGVVVVTASGTAEFNSNKLDMMSCSITTGASLDNSYLTRTCDFGATAITDMFAAFVLTRGYNVSSGIFYTYNLVCEGSLGSVVVQDTNISAIFTPEAFAGASSR